MPIHSGKDDKGCFEQYGSKGAKYYHECGNEQARANAKKKAIAQANAAGATAGEYSAIDNLIKFINFIHHDNK
jgi:uncharacterized radical SAM superfamily Fe-S cluster-containing enzyme